MAETTAYNEKFQTKILSYKTPVADSHMSNKFRWMWQHRAVTKGTKRINSQTTEVWKRPTKTI